MKKIWISDPDDSATPKAIIYSAIAAIAAAAVLWAIWPGAGHKPSTNPEIWNFFGAYMSGVAGPLVNLATLWMLYVTVHQARKVNATQEVQLRQAASAADADQRDRTFTRLLETHQTLLAQIGVNDANKQEQSHPWRGIDGLLHLLNRAIHHNGKIGALRDQFIWSAARRVRLIAPRTHRAKRISPVRVGSYKFGCREPAPYDRYD